MRKAIATVTIEFPRPVKGSELMALVKNVIETAGDERVFYSDQYFDDGDVFTVGRASGYPEDHLLVAPSRENSGVRPEDEYVSAIVASTSWPVSTYLVDVENYEEVVTQEVRDFADALKQAMVAAPASETATWPQEVYVCALCGKIVGCKDGDFSVTSYSCLEHGDNVPTRTVKVTLVGQ